MALSAQLYDFYEQCWCWCFI